MDEGGETPRETTLLPRRLSVGIVGNNSGGSGDLVLIGPELLLDALHLVFETQLELLKSNFLYFFVFGKEPLSDEGIKLLGVLRMLLGQFAKFRIAFEELRSEFRRSHL